MASLFYCAAMTASARKLLISSVGVAARMVGDTIMSNSTAPATVPFRPEAGLPEPDLPLPDLPTARVDKPTPRLRRLRAVAAAVLAPPVGGSSVVMYIPPKLFRDALDDVARANKSVQALRFAFRAELERAERAVAVASYGLMSASKALSSSLKEMELVEAKESHREGGEAPSADWWGEVNRQEAHA